MGVLLVLQVLSVGQIKILGSLKSVIAIHPVAVEIFQSGPQQHAIPKATLLALLKASTGLRLNQTKVMHWALGCLISL